MPCLLHRLVILSQTWWLKALIKNIWQVQSGCFLESQLISFAPYDVFLWKQRKKNKTKQKETILTDNTRINDEKRTSLSMHQITCGSSCASWTFQDTNYPWSWTWKMWWKIYWNGSEDMEISSSSSSFLTTLFMERLACGWYWTHDSATLYIVLDISPLGSPHSSLSPHLTSSFFPRTTPKL